MFDIEHLTLEQVIFEVRYEHAFLYWDNCGKIFNDILKGWPKAQVDFVSLEEARIVLKEEDMTLLLGPQKISFIQFYPANISPIGEFADFSLTIIVKYLVLGIFPRLGNRFLYMNKLENTDEAVTLLNRAGILNISSDKIARIGNTLKSPGVKFTITREDGTGYNFNLAQIGRKLEIQVPKPVKYDMSRFITNGLLMDVDFHTLKPVEYGNVKCLELIKKNKKDIEYILKELFR